MLIDGRTIPSGHTLQTDVCIVGAGAAGIALATELAGQRFRVLLLESGGLDSDAETQGLYDGSAVGLPYYPLAAARLRYFGGSTNHWSGLCWPLTDADFEYRDWIPYSGWPFAKTAIVPYYKRALGVVQLEHDEWAPEFWAEADKPVLPLTGGRMVTVVRQRAWPDGRRVLFGQVYRDRVVQAWNVTACLHSNALRIDTNDSGQRVTRIQAATLAGNRFSIAAKRYVLASGGIENARLLLLSTATQPAGVGNQHGLVGRFFLEHPHCVAAIVRPSNPYLPIRLYQYHRVKGTLMSAGLGLTEAVRRRERLVSVSLDLEPIYEELYARAWASSGMASLRRMLTRLRRGDMPEDVGEHLRNVAGDLDDVAVSAYAKVRFGNDYPLDRIKVIATIDPAPNPESRITLGRDLDQLGQRRVKLDWRLSPIDKRSVRRTVELLATELGRAGLGRVQVTVDESPKSWPADLVGAWHHMGTTRMSHDPRLGVVDANCRVHGVSNLFVAGSSVFPTAGSGTPTLLLVALALRLAEHLKAQLR